MTDVAGAGGARRSLGVRQTSRVGGRFSWGLLGIYGPLLVCATAAHRSCGNWRRRLQRWSLV